VNTRSLCHNPAKLSRDHAGGNRSQSVISWTSRGPCQRAANMGAEETFFLPFWHSLNKAIGASSIPSPVSSRRSSLLTTSKNTTERPLPLESKFVLIDRNFYSLFDPAWPSAGGQRVLLFSVGSATEVERQGDWPRLLACTSCMADAPDPPASIIGNQRRAPSPSTASPTGLP
jgi:hypothetical protein